jgi:hypothetical protein
VCICVNSYVLFMLGAHSSVVGEGTGSRKAASSFPDELTENFNSPNSSSCNVFLDSIQPLTEINTRKLPCVCLHLKSLQVFSMLLSYGLMHFCSVYRCVILYILSRIRCLSDE